LRSQPNRGANVSCPAKRRWAFSARRLLKTSSLC
jgi:hypothetical protein